MPSSSALNRTPMLPYRKLPSRLQHFVNGHLSFETKALLRTTSKFAVGADLVFSVNDLPGSNGTRYQAIRILIAHWKNLDRLYDFRFELAKSDHGDEPAYAVSTFRSTKSLDMQRWLRILDNLTSIIPSQAVLLQHRYAVIPFRINRRATFAIQSRLSYDSRLSEIFEKDRTAHPLYCHEASVKRPEEDRRFPDSNSRIPPVTGGSCGISTRNGCDVESANRYLQYLTTYIPCTGKNIIP
ncbi:unnamed protein product, partial [Mesorhabditis spiculigera]